MSTPSANQNPQPVPRAHLRRKAADRAAGALHNIAIYTTYPRKGDDDWIVRVSNMPVLQRILDQAPQVAASGEPDAVRVGRSASGRITVIRLHGPDWSLSLSAGRPVPDTLLVVLDHCRRDDVYRDGDPTPWSMRDPGWLTEIARMVEAIHTALATHPGTLR